MELFARFKKDYGNYLISTILPVIISAFSIPLFKRILGSENYGLFALWLNAILIVTAILSGWIMQSIIRFFPAATHKGDFSTRSLLLSLRVQLAFIVPVCISTWLISSDIRLSFLFAFVLFTSCTQFTILPIVQSSFMSKRVILSELIRVILYVGGSLVLLKLTEIYFLYSLLFSSGISYLMSSAYLLWRGTGNMKLGQVKADSKGEGPNSVKLIKNFYRYGIPLSFWFVVSYLIGYVDKLFSLSLFGQEFQGNYQAIFDLTNKSINLIMLPILTALFPLLTSAYETGNKHKVKGFLLKIFLYELAGFFLVVIGYWLFGADLIFYILQTPATDDFKWSGFLIICGSFIWQFAILAQKKYELNKRTGFLLILMSAAFTLEMLFYLAFRGTSNKLLAPFGFLVATSAYLILLMIPELVSYLRIRKTKAFSDLSKRNE